MIEGHNNNIQSQANSNVPVNNEGKRPPAMKIVGYNLLVLAAYTIICTITNKDGGAIFDMFFIGIHFFIGIILAIVNKSWIWLLSALMVLIIGFSTCVGMLSISGL